VIRQTLFTLFALAAPRAVLACSVCFGNSDSPMAKATNLGIIAMLVVVVGMLASFAAFFIYLNRRARLIAESNKTEGTAQC
jgi:hypothetical protein